jgi:phenylacetic acid degradation operon negative regulatory protein
MAQSRNTPPLTARSVVASTLLGVDPPRLPTRLLVRSGELFGISQGTTRVALSRMVSAGELVSVGDGHELAGHLLERQARQRASRVPTTRAWDGRWVMAVVVGGARASDARAELRRAMAGLRMGELREGVWLRPDNLVGHPAPGLDAVVDAQCQRFTMIAAQPPGGAAGRARPRIGEAGPADHRRARESDQELASRLWDLARWNADAEELRGELGEIVGSLERGDTAALAPGFVLSAAVLRHLLADPLLPPELLPSGWSGDALRHDYDRYDAAFKALWRDWFRRAHDPA